MKYRKKPVTIEAFKYAYESRPDWFNEAVSKDIVITHIGDDSDQALYEADIKDYYCIIKTLEGEMRCNSGDYVIQGVKGELYPCRKDIFEQTYEVSKTLDDIEDDSLFHDESQLLFIDSNGKITYGPLDIELKYTESDEI